MRAWKLVAAVFVLKASSAIVFGGGIVLALSVGIAGAAIGGGLLRVDERRHRDP